MTHPDPAAAFKLSKFHTLIGLPNRGCLWVIGNGPVLPLRGLQLHSKGGLLNIRNSPFCGLDGRRWGQIGSRHHRLGYRVGRQHRQSAEENQAPQR